LEISAMARRKRRSSKRRSTSKGTAALRRKVTSLTKKLTRVKKAVR